MQKGDISNSIAPRLLVVFENLIGLHEDARAAGKESLYLKARQYKRAVATYTLNEAVANLILDTVWRGGYSVDVVTFKGPEFAEEVDAWLDRHGVVTGQVVSTTSDRLARQIAYQPHLYAVFDPDPAHAFRYGAKGRHISPAVPRFF